MSGGGWRWSPPRWAIWCGAVAGAITATVAAVGPIREGAGWLVRPAIADEVQVQMAPVREMLGVLVCVQIGGVPVLANCLVRTPEGRVHRVPLADSAALVALAAAPAAPKWTPKGGPTPDPVSPPVARPQWPEPLDAGSPALAP